jgi:hypothetical protein
MVWAIRWGADKEMPVLAAVLRANDRRCILLIPFLGSINRGKYGATGHFDQTSMEIRRHQKGQMDAAIDGRVEAAAAIGIEKGLCRVNPLAGLEGRRSPAPQLHRAPIAQQGCHPPPPQARRGWSTSRRRPAKPAPSSVPSPCAALSNTTWTKTRPVRETPRENSGVLPIHKP